MSAHWRGVAAPFRPLRPRLPIWVAGAVALAVIGGLFAWISFGLNGMSDDVFERARQLPPASMPQIVRASRTLPPLAPRVPLERSTLDVLRGFLQPEIEQGLVSVVGTEAIPIIRISSHAMFPSGSAFPQPQFNTLLERIGAALKDERGPVRVIGYTDNQPIRTLQFPSNFQLSAARAKAVADIISRVLGTPGRVTTEGRADADPIKSNATPQGREENRRIEVMLRRES